MLPCRLYAKNIGKEGFVCEYASLESSFYTLFRKDCQENTYCEKRCPRFAECVKLAGETFRLYDSANVVVNDFGENKREIVVYNDEFRVLKTVVNDTTDKSRCFKQVGDVLVPAKAGATVSALNKSIRRSGKHSLDSFKGYAYSNAWMYFFTFTFSPCLVESRTDRFYVGSLWRKMQQKFKRLDAFCRILNAPEQHKDGAWHMHCLLNFDEVLPIVDYGDVSKLPQRTCNGGPDKGKRGFCTFTPEGKFTFLPETEYKVFLVPYYNYGEIQRSSLGDMLFCLNVYPYGINSCAILPGDDTNRVRVSNYLSVYMMKDGNTQYNEKRFMRTRNLKAKTKFTLHLNEEEIQSITQDGFSAYKTTDKMTVYRNFNLSSDKPGVPTDERMKR